MPFDTNRVRALLRAGDIKTVFREELGWDRLTITPITLKVKETEYTLTPLAEKRGLQVFACGPDAAGKVLDSSTRAALERQLTPLAYQHLIVFTNKDTTTQTWQWARQEAGKPVVVRNETFVKGLKEERLVQRLYALYIDIAEEEALTGTDVADKAKQAFDKNAEKVTKKFYERFKNEHGAFLTFIKGIEAQGDREWYASLMLNRLMFVYFVQKKGFLDGDRDYLRHKLDSVQQRRGQGQFYSFYRLFLLRLFHEGLNAPDRDTDLLKLIGKVPYLNGGLFDVHQLERDNTTIDIPDDAFVRIFDFFDDYDWHLDERPLREDREINPDVLGYIFEKYINQKQMGAYYTKEDITEYIGKNTIIPFLFDAAEKECTIAFRPEGALWGLLRENPDRYIYDAVLKGVDEPLPASIAAGVKDVAKRDGWNRPADAAVALPTETWREHVARRERALDLRSKLKAGEIHTINDLITYNLDIRQFAQDAIQTSEGPELLRAFYRAIERITVLDPTCGSGAFLFAALNILEPLYEACLERMQAFVDDLEHSAQPHSPAKFKDFRETLAQVETHPNRRYFILKSIILNNLYGVDIMEEAVEICKLRLFLKLAAQVEPDADKPNYGIEPLPDIDFNIRAGNTLVGFATYDDVKRALTAKLDFENAMPEIEEGAEEVARAFRLFQEMQTKRGMAAKDFAQAKQELRRRLGALDEKLNRYLALEYGVYAAKKAEYEKWKTSHQPFHWFVEFYGIMKRGGFDVIIGNPPYVEYSKVQTDYKLQSYSTITCGNLYANVMERSLAITRPRGLNGMIVQLPIVCTDRMIPLQQLLAKRSNFICFSTYDDRPARLFDGLEHIRATVVINKVGLGDPAIWTSKYTRWFTEARSMLFTLTAYSKANAWIYSGAFPKIGSAIEIGIEGRLRIFKPVKADLSGSNALYFHNAPQYWIRAMTFKPYFWNERHGAQLSTQVKQLVTRTETDAKALAAVLNSSLFYWWFIVLSDCRHLNLREIERFPVSLSTMTRLLKDRLAVLSDSLMLDYRKHAYRKEANYKTTGKVIYDEYYPRYSKPIIDEIDRVLAQHYGFTDEELDFIVNYDIKYRMGQSADEE